MLTKTPNVPSVKRTLEILQLLAGAERGMSISALSRKLNFPKSTTHTIVNTLKSLGYVQIDDETGRFRVSLKLLEITKNLIATKVDLRTEEVYEQLRRITDHTNLSSHCAVLEDGEAVYIAKVDTPGMIKLATWIGRRMEAHCTAVGKAMLAYMPKDQLEAFLKQRRLPRHTDKTIITHDGLRRELERIRECGWSYEDEEFGLGMRCVGAPIVDRAGRAVAAISASGTTGQIHKDNVDKIQQIVKEAARRVARHL